MTTPLVAVGRLLLLDLDNTLIDRDRAFRRGVARLLQDHNLPRDDLDWVIARDGGGYVPREQVAAAMRARWGRLADPEAITRFLESGAMEHVQPDPVVDTVLKRAMRDGWTLVVITNGGSTQQRGKLRRSGLEKLVTDVMISEEVGTRKPDRGIFEAAVASTGVTLDDAWMIGDNLDADIAGANAVGINSVWLSRDRVEQPPGQARPTYIAASLPEAIDLATASAP